MKKNKKIVAIIPSRMGSTRFPGKPLVPILGLPMIEHVRRRAELMDFIDEVYVATCDDEIRHLVESHGGKVIMTDSCHERCTDRIEEAARSVEADIIVNIQGDEPMILADAVKAIIDPFFLDDMLKTTCLVYPIKDVFEIDSPNIVKTALSRSCKLLYLSRSRIPGKEIDLHKTYYKQSGVMAFAKDFLHLFSRLESTPLEQKESVDMLRALEHDYSIQGVCYEFESKGIDIPDQVRMLEDLITSSQDQMKIFQQISK